MYNEVNTSSPLKSFFHQKWVRIVLILDLLTIIVVIGVAIYNSMKTSIVTFNITPVDAAIIVNGTKYENGTYKFSPGAYDVTISHPELNSKTFHLDLASDSSTLITTFLSATDDDDEPSFNFYEQSPNYYSFQALASIASKANNQTTDHDTSAEDFIAEYQKLVDIYYSDTLPINYQSYTKDEAGEPLLDKSIVIKRADSKAPCQKLLCVQVLTIDADDRNFANSLMEQKGFNLQYMEIFYENF